MKRFLGIIVLVMLPVTFLIASGQKDDGTTTIALVPKTMSNPYYVDMAAGAQKAADAAGIELLVQAAEREIDVEKQMQIVENLVIKQVDAILLVPSGSKEIVSAVKKAQDAGIPVIIIDTKLNPDSVAAAGVKPTTFIGSDNYMGGQIAAEYVIEHLNGKGNVAVIEGISGHETSDARCGGFIDEINKTDIKIVSSQTAQWERNKGFDVFQNMLTAHPEIEAVFAANDLMALGAVEAIDQAGKTGDIMVIGFDAQDDAIKAIEQGTMVGTVAQYPSEMGRMAVESALKLLNGETIPEVIPTKVELIQ